MLTLPSSPELASNSSILYFSVENIASAYAQLSRRGVAFIREPFRAAVLDASEIWMAFFSDGQGNTHAITEERARQQKPPAV